MPTITDLIQKLIDDGVRQLTLGPAPKGGLFIQAQQPIGTGADGNNCIINHQKAGAPLPEMLESLSRDVLYCAELQAKIIRPRN